MRLLLLACSTAALAQQPYDLLIRNGRIIDGSGNPWYRADLGIRGGRIAAIGRLTGNPAARTVDATGLTVAPGFIDMMGASSEPLLMDRSSAESKLRQGITTILAGEGGSTAPSDAWPTFEAYFRKLESEGIPLNTIHNVGAAQVRQRTIGVENRAPTTSELDRMRALVEQAMHDGAVGLSTALIYPPGTYATTEELIELAKVAGKYGGLYFTHMRNESFALLDAIREAITIGERAGVPVHIFHLKAAGQDNWPLMQKAIGLIQASRDRGLDVTADIYPYIRNGLGLTALLHPRHFSKGAEPFLKTLSDPQLRQALRKEVEETADWENWYRHAGRNWDNILIARVPDSMDKRYEGKSLAQISRLRGTDDWTTFFDLLQQGGWDVSVNPKSMNEEQKHMALRTQWISFCTDAAPTPITSTGAHPRAFGSFARILGKYVREEKVITLEEAIRKGSSLPANRLGLTDRGRVAPGMAADLILFDADSVTDTATFEKPLSHSTGIRYVFVNGVPVIDDGRFLPANPGAVLRRQ